MVFRPWDKLFIGTFTYIILYNFFVFLNLFNSNFLSFIDIVNTSNFLLMIWTSYHPSLIVSRMFSQRTPCSLLKYASNGVMFITLNVDGIWTVHLIRLHIPLWNCVTVFNPHLFSPSWMKIYHIQSPREERGNNLLMSLHTLKKRT